jgi:holo-[acyl-carrier protein] synthase
MKSIGIDTVGMERFKQILVGSDKGFIENFFTGRERKYCAGTPNPAHSFAGHYAAKEALVKAIPILRQDLFDWRDIEVVHTRDGAPHFAFNERIQENLKNFSVTNVLLTISHTAETAFALVAVI